MLQLSTYSANNANRHEDVVRSVEPILGLAGLELAATVHADGNMMSMAFARGVPRIRDVQLQERFGTWLKNATALKQTSAHVVDTPESRLAVLSKTARIVLPERSGFLSGETKTTQIGYINRRGR